MEGDKVTISITSEDFKNAPLGYIGSKMCPLHQALKRVEGISYETGIDTVYIPGGGIKYTFDFYDWGDHNGPWGMEKITETSERAKRSLEGIPTVELKLTTIN
jgi:hypothetical protein